MLEFIHKDKCPETTLGAAEHSFTLNPAGAAAINAAFDSDRPLCGWIKAEETVSMDWTEVACADRLAARSE
jgi:hypothetical protein